MKRTTKKRPKIHELSTGNYALMKGISPMLIDQVQAAVKDPPVPIVKLDTGEDYPNPNDPDYIAAMSRAQSLRERRMLHAIVFFGMQLCDEEGNPIEAPNDNWELQLKMVGVNWKDEIQATTGELDEEELKFARAAAYLMFIGITVDDMPEVMKIAGADEEEQRKAEAMFQRSPE